MTWPPAPAVMFGCPSCGQAVRLYWQEPRPRWRDRIARWLR